jgi:hypothetical protein
VRKESDSYAGYITRPELGIGIVLADERWALKKVGLIGGPYLLVAVHSMRPRVLPSGRDFPILATPCGGSLARPISQAAA